MDGADSVDGRVDERVDPAVKIENGASLCLCRPVTRIFGPVSEFRLRPIVAAAKKLSAFSIEVKMKEQT